MKYQSERETIIRYAKLMYTEHLVSATSGNISVRLKDREDAFAITPSSENYMSMTEDRIVIMTTDGEILEAAEGAKPSSEWRLHAEFYRSKEEVNAVVHTHSVYATAFAVAHKTIPQILIEMKVFLKGGVPLAPYAPNGSLELARNTVSVIGDKGACLMENHGVVAVGENLEKAYTRATYTEEAAKIYILSKTLGTPFEIE